MQLNAALSAHAWRHAHDSRFESYTLSATTMTRPGILRLSVELLVEILGYLDHMGLLCCRQVSLGLGPDLPFSRTNCH